MTKAKREELILLGTDWTSISPDTLKNLSPYTLNNLSPDTLKNLSPYTLNNLSPYTLNNLSPYTLNNLSPDTLNNLNKYKELSKWDKPYTKLLEAIKRPGCSLDMSSWHTCDTTHCIAGWTVTLAPGGKELEKLVGTSLAAKWILEDSRPGSPLPRFDGNAPEDAIMAFVEARAKEEK